MGVRCIAGSALAAAAMLAVSLPATARIEIMLMGRTNGLKPPPLGDGIWFRGTPFGHMALYIESAARDDEKIVRQAEEGEPAGLVLTVDKELKGSFFTAMPRDEFFYGGLDPGNVPESVTREQIEDALTRFDRKYGQLYNKGPGISGFGQDYGVLYVRKVWGLVYPTTRDEEAKIIEHWQEQRHDEFVATENNCVGVVNKAMFHAGLIDRQYYWRGYGCYNSWTHWMTYFTMAGMEDKTPDGTYLRRDGTCVTEYPQIRSDAVIPSGRPFNAWSLWNMEFLIWLAPPGTLPVTGMEPIDYTRYPIGDLPASEGLAHNALEREGKRHLSRCREFIMLWPRTIKLLWWVATR